MPRPIYSGTRRKLVLAFDVGTTYSGVSYRYLTLCCHPRPGVLTDYQHP
jgi:hypothetical protein